MRNVAEHFCVRAAVIVRSTASDMTQQFAPVSILQWTAVPSISMVATTVHDWKVRELEAFQENIRPHG